MKVNLVADRRMVNDLDLVAFRIAEVARTRAVPVRRGSASSVTPPYSRTQPIGPRRCSARSHDQPDLGLIVRSADDVDRWAEFLKHRGVTLDALPRTHRDGARSCYFRDPEGNQIQVIHHPPISDKV